MILRNSGLYLISMNTVLAEVDLRIGPEIDPGVPWCETLNNPDQTRPALALALKSGNFGAENFFLKAFGMLP